MKIERDDHEIYCILQGERIGYIEYSKSNVITASYIFVEPEHRGSKATKLLLEDLMAMSKEMSLKINPTCGYMKKFFTEKHPEYMI